MRILHVFGAVILACALTHASDFMGVYARIDKVVLEPNSDSPQRIQVWGVFSIANRRSGSDYDSPARGYLYFKLDRNPQSAVNEWNDLKQVAGTSEIVAFGMRGQTVRLRKSDEKPDNPDSYPVNIGVVKVRSRSGYPIQALLDFKD